MFRKKRFCRSVKRTGNLYIILAKAIYWHYIRYISKSETVDIQFTIYTLLRKFSQVNQTKKKINQSTNRGNFYHLYIINFFPYFFFFSFFLVFFLFCYFFCYFLKFFEFFFYTFSIFSISFTAYLGLGI